MPYETAAHQWEEGLRRLEQAPAEHLATLERVTGRIEDELRRRLGGPYTADELAALYAGLRRTAEAENRSLLEVSQGVGLAFLLSARKVSREHLVVPYREDWKPLRDEGFGAYARRVSVPYGRAIESHFDPQRETWTERGAEKVTDVATRFAARPGVRRRLPRRLRRSVRGL